jgi:hypothetical protein
LIRDAHRNSIDVHACNVASDEGMRFSYLALCQREQCKRRKNRRIGWFEIAQR